MIGFSSGYPVTFTLTKVFKISEVTSADSCALAGQRSAGRMLGPIGIPEEHRRHNRDLAPDRNAVDDRTITNLLYRYEPGSGEIASQPRMPKIKG